MRVGGRVGRQIFVGLVDVGKVVLKVISGFGIVLGLMGGKVVWVSGGFFRSKKDN